MGYKLTQKAEQLAGRSEAPFFIEIKNRGGLQYFRANLKQANQEQLKFVYENAREAGYVQEVKAKKKAKKEPENQE